MLCGVVAGGSEGVRLHAACCMAVDAGCVRWGGPLCHACKGVREYVKAEHWRRLLSLCQAASACKRPALECWPAYPTCLLQKIAAVTHQCVIQVQLFDVGLHLHGQGCSLLPAVCATVTCCVQLCRPCGWVYQALVLGFQWARR